MALTSQEIARVANLARLELRPDETDRVLGQLNGFFALVEQMQAVNTDGVEPLAHPAAILGDIALRLFKRGKPSRGRYCAGQQGVLGALCLVWGFPASVFSPVKSPEEQPEKQP